MQTWRCAHCGTPQAEAQRCWVCHRSSTSCASCRHFRHSVAGRLGYCGLDAGRTPLTGEELRGCWEAPRSPTQASGRASELTPSVRDGRRPRLDFVPVDPAGSSTSSRDGGREADPGFSRPPDPTAHEAGGFWAEEI